VAWKEEPPAGAAAAGLVPPDTGATVVAKSSPAPQRSRRGRTPGAGAIDDSATLRRMLELLAAGEALSVHAAAVIVADTAAKHTRPALIGRLRRKFADTWGTEPPRGKTWADFARELHANCTQIVRQ
jgi:hypothetical protein